MPLATTGSRPSDVTEAATSRVSVSPGLPAPSASAKERTGGGGAAAANGYPDETAAARMGRTGGGVFPCCGKEAVEVLEPQIDFAHCDFSPRVAQEEDKAELEEELLAQKPDPDSIPELESLERAPSPQLTFWPEPELKPKPEPKPKPVDDHCWKVTTLLLCHKSFGQPAAPRHQHVREEAPVSPRSCCTQTSKHLFWADKLVQASDHNSQRATPRQDNQGSIKSIKHQGPRLDRQPTGTSTCPALTATGTQPPPGPQPPAIGLVEVVHFATALAVASSSCIDLQSLGQKIKAPSPKAVEPLQRPIQPTLNKEQAGTQEDKNQPSSILDFSDQGLGNTALEGEVKLLQTGAMSPQVQDASQEDSVLGTKKEKSLLLKIHFKMSSSPIPKN